MDRSPSSPIELTRPSPTDALALRSVAEAAGGLDVNPTYAYALWARDFADTTVVARRDGEVVGYVTAFRRPRDPDTAFVWQVAVHPECRGQRLAARMLHALVDRDPSLTALEATVTSDNTASLATFSRFAADRDAEVSTSPLFGADHLGDDHAPEDLLRIEPLQPT